MWQAPTPCCLLTSTLNRKAIGGKGALQSPLLPPDLNAEQKGYRGCIAEPLSGCGGAGPAQPHVLLRATAHVKDLSLVSMSAVRVLTHGPAAPPASRRVRPIRLAGPRGGGALWGWGGRGECRGGGGNTCCHRRGPTGGGPSCRDRGSGRREGEGQGEWEAGGGGQGEWEAGGGGTGGGGGGRGPWHPSCRDRGGGSMASIMQGPGGGVHGIHHAGTGGRGSIFVCVRVNNGKVPLCTHPRCCMHTCAHAHTYMHS